MEPFQLAQDEFFRISPWQDQFPHVMAGFTSKNGGFSTDSFCTFNLGLHVHDSKESVNKNRKKLSQIIKFPTEEWVCSEQVHDHHIKKVTRSDRGKGVYVYEEGIPHTDGIYTDESNVLLTSVYADCVPLYFFVPSRGLIGLAHAGWKGTVKQIASRMVKCWIEDEGVNIKDIFVAIGPSIHDCCYVVDDRVINEVVQTLAEGDKPPFKEVSSGQYSLHLSDLNHLLLKKMGIKESNILISSRCTSCEEDLFFSHRRDQGKTGRMMSFIGYKED
ncbi:YfiH family protein [Bacillus mesophilus]|uniref:Purine nucleoside phosphorylase n=1 Tax=Bacillus mesophilus TaxID=1808955 RepID=A0A6M0Q232_9BACI|nr:peptidoglycan editing factor PgeF [Bacillus mesophilus]MBM7659443.1 YfiH family protein [Bacillus mesophilus]NEY70316.1 peptidoglycan editing factor PgeF [Bacillus mesophilus]